MSSSKSCPPARRALCVLTVALGLALLPACGAPPPLPGSSLETHRLTSDGPRIPVGSIFAAADLPTLRALVDAADGLTAGQLGGAQVAHPCSAPYTQDVDRCWPGLVPRPGQAYVALNVQGGFCQRASAPEVAAAGSSIELRIVFTDIAGCHLSGIPALPTASLVSFATGRLRPGLYGVSYLFQYDHDSYHSDSTYLSVPGPAPAAQGQMEQEAAGALAGVIGAGRAGLFSVARVDGAQLEGLCSAVVAGAAYLVTYEQDVSATPRQMMVALAGTVPRTCSVTRV